MAEFIIYEKIDGIAKITFNRPERDNAFNGQMVREFKEALLDAKWDNDVRVVVLLGNGDHFNKGMDHADSSVILAAAGETVPLDIRRPDTEHDEETWTLVAKLRKPVIAGIHGELVRTSAWLVTLVDCVVAAEGTELHNLEYAIGLNYSDPFPFIHSRVPMSIAREFAFTGYPITTEVGLRCGLYNHVVPREKLEEATMKLAHRMLRMAPYTLTMQKAIADAFADRNGFFSSLPFSKEAINTSLTFVGNPRSDAYWDYAKNHTPDELMAHFHALMNDLRKADDWELGDEK